MILISVKKNKVKSIKGFVMLFAVVLSAIIFSIALGMISISLNEIKFSTSAQATNEAFFAADTGAECALYYDLVPQLTVFGPSVTSSVGQDATDINTMCAGAHIDMNNGAIADDPIGPWTFVVPSLGYNQQSCAIVKVTKTTVNNVVNVNLVSKGYNTGGLTADCTSTNTNRVERVLELNY